MAKFQPLKTGKLDCLLSCLNEEHKLETFTDY